MDNEVRTAEKIISLDEECDKKELEDALRRTEKNLRDMLKDGAGMAKERLGKLMPIIIELQRRGFTYKQIHAKINETVSISLNALIVAVKEYKKRQQ